MNYQDFKNVLHHEIMQPALWEHIYIQTNETLDRHEILDLIVSDCPGMSNILIEGSGTNWYIMLPKGNSLSDTFPGRITTISITNEENV